MNTFTKVIFYFLSTAAILFVVGVGAFFITPKIEQVNKLTAKRDIVLKQIEKKQREIKRLKEKQQRFKSDPEFVEQVARESKLVLPGEYVFIFD